VSNVPSTPNLLDVITLTIIPGEQYRSRNSLFVAASSFCQFVRLIPQQLPQNWTVKLTAVPYSLCFKTPCHMLGDKSILTPCSSVCSVYWFTETFSI
jgi:hypothetical protein